MKNLLLVLTAFLLVSTAFSDPRHKLTPEEKATRRAEFYKRTGGFVKIPPKGYICVVNFQKKVDFDKTANWVKKMFTGFGLTVTTAQGKRPFNIVDLSLYRQRAKAGAVIFLVDDPQLPMSLVSIEERSGLVNVAALEKDHPSKAVLTRRAGKMACRVATLACGGAESTGKNCMMKPISNLRELDANEAVGDEVYVMMGIINGMTRAGVLPEKRMTYLQACREGWAPAPTNAVQQAIWDEMKAEKERGPTNGLQILPPKKN